MEYQIIQVDQVNLNSYLLGVCIALLIILILLLVVVVSKSNFVVDFLTNLKIFGTKIPPKELKDNLKGEVVDMLKEIAVVTSDVNDTIKMFNVGAELMFDYKESEVLGSPTGIIIPDHYKKAHSEGMEKMRLAGHSAVLKKSVYELEGLHKSGKVFPIKLTINQTRHQEGHQLETYYTAFIEDITERRKKENEQKLELELYKQGEVISQIGTWVWDIRNNIVSCTENFNSLFDWRGGKADAQTFMSRVADKDKTRVWEAITKAFQTAEDYEIDYEVNARGFEDVTVHCIAKCTKDIDGFTQFLTGTIRIINNTNEKTIIHRTPSG